MFKESKRIKKNQKRIKKELKKNQKKKKIIHSLPTAEKKLNYIYITL
jgi:hypothetical protein